MKIANSNITTPQHTHTQTYMDTHAFFINSLVLFYNVNACSACVLCAYMQMWNVSAYACVCMHVWVKDIDTKAGIFVSFSKVYVATILCEKLQP